MAAKKQNRNTVPAPADKPATLRDRLDAETLGKLKAQAEAWKAEEQKRAEERRKREAEARAAEQKRLENDFAYLLDNSNLDWRKFKS
ncbi:MULTISPECIES: YqkE family protein [Cohnella]|jgi:transcription elongation GreA/GreB family factor|uniref:YqkE family protein n=1 Tax=Cohnella TaxID=329857 RepID=UPI00035D48E3|nr:MULTISPECIES: YqkE family protein [Cohnella]REK68158.1 MAG: DUF3886 domain-containing protein [Cohnella sp.]